MMRKILTSLAVLITVASLVATPSVGAQTVDIYGACQGSDSGFCANKNLTAEPVLKKILEALMTILGIVSVIMLIWGGIRYTTSAGDSNKVTSAKNTIIYAVVGIVVALLAYAIIGYVYNKVTA